MEGKSGHEEPKAVDHMTLVSGTKLEINVYILVPPYFLYSDIDKGLRPNEWCHPQCVELPNLINPSGTQMFISQEILGFAKSGVNINHHKRD